MLRFVALVAVAGGCLDAEPPSPDISNLEISVRWSTGHQRWINVSVPEIPCFGSEDGLLGDSGVECVSAPWTLLIDGAPVETTPVECTSAHEGLFGHVDKYCTGGRVGVPLDESGTADIELVAATRGTERRLTLAGVRRDRGWIQEAAFRSSTQPGLILVDDLEAGSGSFSATFTPPGGGASIRGTAQRAGADVHRLELRLDATKYVDGVYAVHADGYMRVDGITLAVPINGALTVAH